MNHKRVYLAAPLFTSAERAWNDHLAAELRKQGFDVILPQEEASSLISGGVPDFAGIFSKCLEGVRSTDLVLAILDGGDVDSGTAFECGYAYAVGKPIIGLRTDLRFGGEENGVNAMLNRCCQRLVRVPAFNPDKELVDSVIAALSAANVPSVR